MNNIYTKLSVVAIIAVLATPTVIPVSPAAAWYCSNCADRFTQATEVAQQIETAINTAQTLQTQIRQYENMLQQGLSLPTTSLNPVTDSMMQLRRVYNQGQHLSGQMSGFTADYRAQYQDFDSFLTEAGGDPAALGEYYGNWSDQTSEAARAAMQSSGMNINQIDDETDMLSTLVDQSQSAQGRMQAVQAGNQINAMLVQQMQKMRVMVNDQISASSIHQANIAARDAAAAAANETALGGSFTNSSARSY